MIELVEKTQDELDVWIDPMWDNYVEQRVGAGEERDAAVAQASMQRDQLFPDGKPADGQHVMNALHDGAPVGILWMGKPFGPESGTWFVFYVEVDEQHRGKGFGRETMEAAEAWTIAQGGCKIGLNVFGPNTVARSLYDSLGFTVQATSMFKEL
jgi:ribosomal protein S18 acetylase RimI-like enzyme